MRMLIILLICLTGCFIEKPQDQIIVLNTGDSELNIEGFEGFVIVAPAQGGSKIDSIKNGRKIVILQISPDAQETVIMVYSKNIALQGNTSWEMTNGDVLVLYFLTPSKAIEISRVDR